MGFYVAEPEARQAPLPDVVGPIVKLMQCSDLLGWNAVVFVACRGSQPILTFDIDGGEAVQVDAQVLENVLEWTLIRYPLHVGFTATPQRLKYRVHTHAGGGDTSGSIVVPGRGDEWNIVAYSCYDQRRGIGEALWRHVAGRRDRAVHAIVGAGDQLYSDNIWNEEPLKAWLALPPAERLSQPATPELEECLQRTYLYSYLRHTHFHPAAAFLRDTPQINTWDDHDIFDGWGSYPPDIQTCPVFTAIFREAQRAYLLFQQCTSSSLAASDGFILHTSAPANGDAGHDGASQSASTSYSFMTQLGPSVALVSPDTRSERSRARIMPEALTRHLAMKMKEFPATVQHLIFVSASPLIYPRMKILEKLLKSAEDEHSLLHKTGLARRLNNAFGLPDLLDDVTDHWSCTSHAAEKAELLGLLREVAEQRRLRVSVITGDVHLAAFTWVASDPPMPQALDPGFMPQIVTSGIGNHPPGDFVLKYLESAVEWNRVVARCSNNVVLRETVSQLFKDEKRQRRSKSKKFLNRMNVCELGAEMSASGVVTLKFELLVLNDAHDGVGAVLRQTIPPVLPHELAKEAELYELDDIKPKRARLFGCCQCCVAP